MDIGEQFGVNSGLIGAVSIASILFGIIYAVTIHLLREYGWLKGYTAFAVVAGVITTVTLSAFIIGLKAALIVVLFFICTGTPMILGDIYQNRLEAKRESGNIEIDILQALGAGDD